ncbi:MAG: trypsin-like peptidase domain-containing protein, partial [Chloroflexota bacterium]
VSPGTVTLGIGKSQQFSTEAADTYGNPIPEAQITWEASGGVGNISDKGLLTTGTRAGTFTQAVKTTANLGSISTSSSSSVTVTPDPLEALAISPSPVEVAAGTNKQIEAVATDKYGNRIPEVQVAWTMSNANAGSITATGLLTGGEIAKSFADAVEAKATQGSLTRTAKVSVNVVPGPLEQLVIAPNLADIGMGMTQQFVALGGDKFGNRISGLALTWSVDAGGGTVDAKGLFTAGTNPGTFNKTVKASISQGSITRSATANVTVEADRIIFVSDRDDGDFSLYIMNLDGTDVKQLTTGDIGFPVPSWSPDGKLFAYDSCTLITCDIIISNDDGDWQFSIASDVIGGLPAWSPDSKKIAFVHSPSDKEQLYIMDIDGGNQKRLINELSNNNFPAWSPDSREIVFVSDRDGNTEIYVMNADGSKQTRLTTNAGLDAFPSWSPDGKSIVFQSDRSDSSGAVSREIYIMNTDGSNLRRKTVSVSSNCPAWLPDGGILFHSFRDSPTAELYIANSDGTKVTRLTSNDAITDICPKFVPRKGGVTVSEATLVIPGAKATKALTPSELTAKVRAAVVRIETNLVSGSGSIIDSNGLILTNNHVIKDAKEIKVFLDDGTSFTGTVLGRDLVRDLAVVKIQAQGLPVLELGDMSQVPLGTDVMVLGYPLGSTSLTVTKGIASAFKSDTGRNIAWVQTDSAVNPGNSGGPLFNLQGQVIGMVSAKIISFGVENVGFAISVDTIKLYLDRLKAGETITN